MLNYTIHQNTVDTGQLIQPKSLVLLIECANQKHARFSSSISRICSLANPLHLQEQFLDEFSTPTVTPLQSVAKQFFISSAASCSITSKHDDVDEDVVESR